jgi:hypothetical protein
MPSARTECDPLPPTLTRYDAIEEGLRFSLSIVEDENGWWMPAEPLQMPFHHASHIDWEDDRKLLAHHHGSRVRVVAVGLGRTSIHQDPHRRMWHATYGARVECVVPEL